MIQKYFIFYEQIIQQSPLVVSYSTYCHAFTIYGTQGIITCVDSSALIFFELLFQDKNSYPYDIGSITKRVATLFRYDNAPHHQITDISSPQPHFKE